MAAPETTAEVFTPAAAGGLPSSPVERWLPSAGLGAALLGSLASPAVAAGLVPWPFLVAALLLGLPHGAADGVLLLRGAGWRERALRLAVYLLLMALAAAALLLVPTFTLVAFLVLSWWHFGAADAEDLPAAAPARVRRAWGFARGGLVIAVPLAAQPVAAWAPFARLAELLGGAAPLAQSWLAGAGALAAVAALLALVPCAGAAVAARPGVWQWTETGLIVLLGLLADPLFAVGCYFLCVHGFRQAAALGGELSGGALSGGAPSAVSPRLPSLLRRLLATHRASLLLLLPSWLLLAALLLLTEPAGLRDLAILSLTLYVVATPPHHLFQELLARP